MSQDIDLFASAGFSLADQVLAGLGGNRPPMISLKDDRFSFVDAAGERSGETLRLNVVVIGVNSHGPSRQYWGRAFDGDDNSDPPKCFSDNGIGPSKEAVEPQHATCKGCPKAEWGSAVSQMTGKGIPACQSRKKLAVLVPELKTIMAWQVNVPAGSFGNLSTYVKLLASKTVKGRPMELFDVVTELFMKDKELFFTAVGYTPDPLKPAILELWASKAHHEVTGENDVPITGLLAAPKAQQAIASGTPIQQAANGPEPPQEAVQQRGPQQATNGAGQDMFNAPGQGQPRGRGRPPGALNRNPPAPKEEVDDVPAFLRSPTERSGVNLAPAAPPSGLSDAIAAAFKLENI